MARPNLSSELLRTFVAVVDADGFQRAAARLHKTQSTVSQQIHRLEGELGTALFRADGRRRRLTAAGETFVGYARRLLDLQGDAVAAVSHPQVQGELRLGVTHSLADGPLSQALAGFVRVYPRIRLHVRSAYSAELAAAFERGELDAVLVLQEAGMAQRETVLVTQPLVWIAADGFAWGRRGPLPLATFDQPCGFHQATVAALDRAGIPWRLVYSTGSIGGLMAAVRTGIAVTARTAHALLPGTQPAQGRLGLPDLPHYDVVLRRSATMAAGERLEAALRDAALTLD